MRAEVFGLPLETQREWNVADGSVIEVLGFVHHSRVTWAVWRDDAGYIHHIDKDHLRMLPNTEELPYLDGSLRVKTRASS